MRRTDGSSGQDSNHVAMSDVVVRTGVKIRGSGTVLNEIRNVDVHQCIK